MPVRFCAYSNNVLLLKIILEMQSRHNSSILLLAVTYLNVVSTFTLWILAHKQKQSLITIYANKKKKLTDAYLL